MDAATLLKAAQATQGLVTVEDHYPAGGLGEAVMAAVAPNPVYSLAVMKKPKSGKPGRNSWIMRVSLPERHCYAGEGDKAGFNLAAG